MHLGLGRMGLPCHAGTIIVNGNPVEPYVFLDFKNAVYTIGGTPAPLSDFLEEDADNWGTFNLATAVQAGVGLSLDGPNQPVLTPSAFAAIVTDGSFTVVATVLVGADPDDTYFSFLSFPDYAFDISAGVIGPVGGKAYLQDGLGSTVESSFTATTGRHKFAMTFSSDNLALSMDGGATFAIDPGGVGTATDFAVGGNSPTDTIIEKFAFYPVQANVDLPGLSAP